MLASQHYKDDLQKEKKRKGQFREKSETQSKMWRIREHKKKTDLQSTISKLRVTIEKQTLLADKNQDLSAITTAAALLRSVNEKEKTVKELEAAQSNIEKELKTL